MAFIAAVLSLTGAVALFCAMAIVAERRFVPALHAIAEELKLPRNVAGATLMAAGASSPELFSNLISVYVTKSDIGVGTIIGSEIFNHMIILAGVCGSRSEPQRLDAITSVRDSSSYLIALVLLLLAVSDIRRQSGDDDVHAVVVIRFATTLPLVAGYGGYVWLCTDAGRRLLQEWFRTWVPMRNDELIVPAVKQETADVALLMEIEEEETETCTACADPLLEPPVGQYEKMIHLFMLPIKALVHATVPSNPYAAVFACAVWLTGLSYGLVLTLEIAATALGMTDALVGLTLGAIGTSIPNLMSAMTAANDGFANMAVSSALGANVFNICIGLGLPWLLYPAVHRGHNYDAMHDTGIDVLCFFLIGTLLLYIVLLAFSRYVLHPQFAFYFIAIYLAFLLLATCARRPFGTLENHEQGGH